MPRQKYPPNLNVYVRGYMYMFCTLCRMLYSPQKSCISCTKKRPGCWGHPFVHQGIQHSFIKIWMGIHLLLWGIQFLHDSGVAVLCVKLSIPTVVFGFPHPHSETTCILCSDIIFGYCFSDTGMRSRYWKMSRFWMTTLLHKYKPHGPHVDIRWVHACAWPWFSMNLVLDWSGVFVYVACAWPDNNLVPNQDDIYCNCSANCTVFISIFSFHTPPPLTRTGKSSWSPHGSSAIFPGNLVFFYDFWWAYPTLCCLYLFICTALKQSIGS